MPKSAELEADASAGKLVGKIQAKESRLGKPEPSDEIQEPYRLHAITCQTQQEITTTALNSGANEA